MKVSIIVPFHNSSLFFRECIESLLHQCDEEYEIICIDDHSEDDSKRIAEGFAQKENIKIYTNPLCGVAEARNYGVTVAAGEYVCFVDSDDLLPERAIAYLLEAAGKSNADVVGGCFSEFDSNNRACCSYSGDLYGYTFGTEGWIAYRDYQFDYGFHRFLYKRAYLIENNLFFPNLVRFQDPPFLVRVLHTAGRFYVINRVTYSYRLSPNGVRWNEEKICDCIRGISWDMQFAVHNKYWKLYELSVSRLVRLLYDELCKKEKQSNPQIREAMSQITAAVQPEAEREILPEADWGAFEELTEAYGGECPLITVVVPAYNVEKYIAQCLNSLVNQTDRRLKIIVVDDGSTDSTGAICEQFANRYSGLIRYVRQENRGLGAARNVGLRLTATKYVSFLDSDDWQDIRFIEKFYNELSKLDCEPDLIFTLPSCYNEASKRVEEWMDKKTYLQIFFAPGQVVNVQKCPALYLLEVNANRKIYRTAFLNRNEFYFPEQVKWEDIRPHIQLVHLAQTCAAIRDTGFVYRTNSGDQITAGRGSGRLDFIKVFQDVLLEIGKRDYSVTEMAYVLRLLCNYTIWMIDMTDVGNINQLLEGLHQVFLQVPDKMIDAYMQYAWDDVEEFSKYKGLLLCMRTEQYPQLADYIDRQNQYRYWILNCGKRKGLIGGGIQCIKDSGIKYTLKLMLKKVFYQGFR